MNIAIVGAGIIGVTTAWELTTDGHEVSVFERRGAAAEEGSFAGTGVVAPARVTPWATSSLRGALSALFNGRSHMRMHWPPGAAELRWLAKSHRAGRADRVSALRAPLQHLASYSRDRLHELTAGLQLEYDRSDGCTVLLRSEKDRASIEPGLLWLREAGIKFQSLDAAQTRLVEPALNPDTEFFGAIHLPESEAGNCRQFALLLKNEAQKRGAILHFGTDVVGISAGPAPRLQLAGEADARVFDAIVLCAGLDSAALLRPLGVRVPLAAVHGYSVSAQIREPLNAPRTAVLDERHGVTIARLGQRVRVAGGAELGGAPEVRRLAALRSLYSVLHDWFPGAAQMSSGVQEWKGAQPCLPDGAPLIGESGSPGIWMNLGHGVNGWTLACGSARVIADLMGGRASEIDARGLGIARLQPA